MDLLISRDRLRPLPPHQVRVEQYGRQHLEFLDRHVVISAIPRLCGGWLDPFAAEAPRRGDHVR